MMIYAGTLDLNGYISVSRKISNASGILSDLITQNVSTISAATIDDAFKGAAMALSPVPEDAVGLEIRAYRLVNNKVTEQWNRKSGSGPSCATPDTSGLMALMTAGNDIVIASVCTDYEPVMSKFIGAAVLGATKFKVESEIKLRPRESITLDCPDC